MTQPTILACFTCPALFKWNGRPISTDAGEPSQSGSCDFNRKLKIADNVGLVFLKVHWKYILHAFELATHLDYQHFCVCVCVPEHAVRSACKGLETTELCFIIVVGLPPNNVEFRFCC